MMNMVMATLKAVQHAMRLNAGLHPPSLQDSLLEEVVELCFGICPRLPEVDDASSDVEGI